MKIAFIVVDVQNDFVEGGALAVTGGLALVPQINRILREFGDGVQVFASRDCHPRQTVHFERWPPHCLAGSSGAEYVHGLELPAGTIHIQKGTTNSDDGYSAFEGLTESGESLAAVLASMGIQRAYVCGIALNFCVGATIRDALRLGYKTALIENATVGIANAAPTPEDTLKSLLEEGCELLRL